MFNRKDNQAIFEVILVYSIDQCTAALLFKLQCVQMVSWFVQNLAVYLSL